MSSYQVGANTGRCGPVLLMSPSAPRPRSNPRESGLSQRLLAKSRFLMSPATGHHSTSHHTPTATPPHSIRLALPRQYLVPHSQCTKTACGRNPIGDPKTPGLLVRNVHGGGCIFDIRRCPPSDRPDEQRNASRAQIAAARCAVRTLTALQAVRYHPRPWRPAQPTASTACKSATTTRRAPRCEPQIVHASLLASRRAQKKTCAGGKKLLNPSSRAGSTCRASAQEMILALRYWRGRLSQCMRAHHTVRRAIPLSLIPPGGA